MTSMNLGQDDRFQIESIKLYALIPKYDADAADKDSGVAHIQKRAMEVNHAAIAAMVCDMNQYSSLGQELLFQVPTAW